MQKLGFPSMKSLNQLKAPSGSSSGTGKAISFSARNTSDSLAMGSFANLKVTAEKLVKEQASVKTDLEMANTKLKKSMELVRALEEKLQTALTENTKLKVKHKEDEKHWKGLESKFSSTKTLCEQLTETLQILAGQVQDAEKDKEFFEDKLSASSAAFDSLNQQMKDLSLKLESQEETIRKRDKELEELRIQKEERETAYRDEQRRTSSLIEDKDSIIRKTEACLEANGVAMERLNSKLKEKHCQLTVKEDETQRLIASQDKLEKDKNDLELIKDELASKLASSIQEMRTLEGFVHLFSEQLVALNGQSSALSDKFDELNAMHDSRLKLTEEKMDFTVKLAQRKHDQLQDNLFCTRSEKDALHLLNEELKNKVKELEKVHESTMAQLSKENCLAGEKIQGLEAEAKDLISKKIEAELLIAKLEGDIASLSEAARSSENMMKDLLVKISTLEVENKESTEKFLGELQKKTEDLEALQKENEKHKQEEDLLNKQVNELHNLLLEKEQLILRYIDKERILEEQISENQGLLTEAESKLAELRKQYDVMLESKQIELARHLKELCQRNDQAINDIRRKYEVEKQEIVHQEKDKVDKVLAEMEKKYEKELAERIAESKQNLTRMQEEHAALVSQIQKENDKKEAILKSKHSEELKLSELQAENELRERTKLLRNEHDARMKAVMCEHEDECRRLLEELNLQKTKEERQRALLQLQWRVMGEPQEDQEVHSKKEYSVSSKMRNPVGGRGRMVAPRMENEEDEEQDSPLPEAAQTPVSKLLKKVEHANPGNIDGVPKHSKKVTQREYEVETTNGRTVAKRRKTKGTGPRKNKKLPSQTIGTPKDGKVIQPVSRPRASNIGDLFSEGSLNPYTDDPYAFD
ncbi:synaptonemal complex protein 1-like isoform X2 [Punica granatum]|uniref:Synaptonemal complex protein 1-like isoform X2 n=1 Tax=Punica granatum TaxID=22663 RepID=A0A6P8DMC4_PUNGR|nr:synaptonemal complex protein 1-like isoform X2 [Punica granatum]